MKVICIDNQKQEFSGLTEGKTYTIVGQSASRYHVINDLGRKKPYDKSRFKPVDKETNLFTDQDVDRLATLFLASGLHEDYGVTFEAYLTAVAPVIAHVRGQ